MIHFFPFSSRPHWFLVTFIRFVSVSRFAFFFKSLTPTWHLLELFHVHSEGRMTELGKILEGLNSLYPFLPLASFFKNTPLISSFYLNLFHLSFPLFYFKWVSSPRSLYAVHKYHCYADGLILVLPQK